MLQTPRSATLPFVIFHATLNCRNPRLQFSNAFTAFKLHTTRHAIILCVTRFELYLISAAVYFNSLRYEILLLHGFDFILSPYGCGFPEAQRCETPILACSSGQTLQRSSISKL